MKVNITFDGDKYKFYYGNSQIETDTLTINNVAIDDKLSVTSQNAVQNRLVTTELKNLKKLFSNMLKNLIAIREGETDKDITLEGIGKKSDYIKVDGATLSVLAVTATDEIDNGLVGGSELLVYLYDENYNEIEYLTSGGDIFNTIGANPVEFDISNAKYIKFMLRYNQNFNFIARAECKIEYTLTFYPAEYEVIDIRNGVDGVIYPTAGEAVRTQINTILNLFAQSEVNILNPNLLIDNAIVLDSGVISKSNTDAPYYMTYTKLNIDESSTYTIQKQEADEVDYIVAYYSEDEAFINSENKKMTNQSNFTTPANASYVSLSIRKANENTYYDLSDLMLSAGIEVKDYEDYFNLKNAYTLTDEDKQNIASMISGGGSVDEYTKVEIDDKLEKKINIYTGTGKPSSTMGDYANFSTPSLYFDTKNMELYTLFNAGGSIANFQHPDSRDVYSKTETEDKITNSVSDKLTVFKGVGNVANTTTDLSSAEVGDIYINTDDTSNFAMLMMKTEINGMPMVAWDNFISEQSIDDKISNAITEALNNMPTAEGSEF